MTIASELRKSEDLFKFAERVVGLLSEHYSLDSTEVWTVLSPNRTVDALKNHFKKERKRNDPLSQIKNARTSFSFFTSEERPKIAKKHPEAKFGELSRLVSAEWNGLSDSQKAKYKQMEEDDKQRHAREKADLIERLSKEAAENPAPAPAPATDSEQEAEAPAESSTEKPTKSRKGVSKGNKGDKGAEEPATTEKASTSKSGKNKSQGKTNKKSGKNRANKAQAVTA